MAMAVDCQDNGSWGVYIRLREMNEIYDHIDSVFQTKTLNLYVSII